jgi:hypothetical protein
MHTDIKKTWKYGRSYTTKEKTYLVDNGPVICPWREVDSEEDCEIGEVFEEFLDAKYKKQSSTDGYRIRNCKNARCRKPYTHNCPSIQKVYYYDDNGNMRSRCRSKRRRLRHRRRLTDFKCGSWPCEDQFKFCVKKYSKHSKLEGYYAECVRWKYSCKAACGGRDEMEDEEVGRERTRLYSGDMHDEEVGFERPPHTRPQKPTGQSIWNSMWDEDEDDEEVGVSCSTMRRQHIHYCTSACDKNGNSRFGRRDSCYAMCYREAGRICRRL